MKSSCEHEIDVYLRRGEHDLLFSAWPGQDLFARARCANTTLREALIAIVRERTPQATVPEALADLDVVAFTRGKVTPMVRGLFPRKEQEAVLEALARATVFLTPGNIDTVLRQTCGLETAWKLANLYLSSGEAELLADDAPRIVGLSEELTCYVSSDYFRTNGHLDDFLIHESAHVFHNVKRETIGLPETRNREWLLDIDFRRRETFAYACEAYGRMVELARTPALRASLLAEHLSVFAPGDERVDSDEYADILREAVAARNGWKRILARSSSRHAKRSQPGARVG